MDLRQAVDHAPDRRNEAHLARPTGWFQIAWSAELGPGEVRPLRYFDQDLVCYRDEAGELHVLDAHCPHLGAHLGFGGSVEGSDIVCPFHGWRWSPAGENVHIPYSSKPNRSKRIGCWAVAERDGLVYLWHDARGGSPSWDPPSVPEVADGSWYGYWPDAVTLVASARVYPQMIIENTVDLAHLKYVHGWDTVPVEEAVEEGDAWFRSRFSGDLATTKGRIDIRNSSEIWGVGIIVSRLEGLRDTIQVMCTTPVEGDLADVRLSVLVKRDPSDPIDERPGLVKGIVKAQTVTEWDKDAPIWEHMRYLDKAAFALEEARAYTALRRWSRRFYPALPEPQAR